MLGEGKPELGLIYINYHMKKYLKEGGKGQ